jgi:hypothetical protein
MEYANTLEKLGLDFVYPLLLRDFFQGGYHEGTIEMAISPARMRNPA